MRLGDCDPVYETNKSNGENCRSKGTNHVSLSTPTRLVDGFGPRVCPCADRRIHPTLEVPRFEFYSNLAILA